MKKHSGPMDLIKTSYYIRGLIIKMLASAGSGHTGGSLGLADVFTSLYFNTINHNPDNPGDPLRDRVILSAGHVAPVLYATLSAAGYFDVSELFTLRKFGSRLQGHPARDKRLPGIETSSGSLGQGLSIAVGMALAARLNNQNFRIYSIHGDGELQEGQIWEAAMSAAHYKLSAITAIVDCNGLQIDGPVDRVMNLSPLRDKWASFGWNVLECDGHNHNEIQACFKLASQNTEAPSVVLAHTKMGKGVYTIENDNRWHGKAPNPEEATEFLCQLNESLKIELSKNQEKS
ncbi:MAG TPA: transketolase [Lentimicrobium sp.]|nr:transketolase [Lentimicrobium sp.]